MSLFDADDYGKATKTARRPGPATPPPHPETVVVRADAVWKLVSSSLPGVTHAFVGVAGRKERNAGAMVTACGTIGVPRLFVPGEAVQGCAACVRAGARVTP